MRYVPRRYLYCRDEALITAPYTSANTKATQSSGRFTCANGMIIVQRHLFRKYLKPLLFPKPRHVIKPLEWITIRGVLHQKLLIDGDNNAGTNGTAAFTDSETEANFDRDRGDELNVHLDVVARHAHFNAFGKGDDAGNVGRTEVELRTVVIEERGMTAAFILGQNVNLTTELGVRMNGARLCNEPGRARSRSC